MSAPSVRALTRQWTGRLAPYHLHKNDEHLEALLQEAMTYAGLHLENELSASSYWSKAPLARRVAVLLFLVDRGVVSRISRGGRIAYEPTVEAERWAEAQPTLATYLAPTLELISALRAELTRRGRGKA